MQVEAEKARCPPAAAVEAPPAVVDLPPPTHSTRRYTRWRGAPSPPPPPRPPPPQRQPTPPRRRAKATPALVIRQLRLRWGVTSLVDELVDWFIH